MEVMVDEPSSCSVIESLCDRERFAMRSSMKLADYLFQSGMTTAQLRRALGLKCRSTINRYLHGERIPTPHIMQQIIALTGGRVQLRDFLSPGNPECATVIKLPNGKQKLVFPWSSSLGDLAAASQVENRRVAANDELSEHYRRAISVIAGRVRRGPTGIWLLDGRPTDLRRIVAEANTVLKDRGQSPIIVPGLTG